MGIEYHKDTTDQMIGFCDADYANNEEDRKSISGSMMQGGISWSHKKQSGVALSTSEAEYQSLSTAVQEASWIRKLTADIDKESVSKPTVIYVDNKAAIDLAHNSCFKARTKHIDTRHHFIKEHIEKKDIILKFIGT